MNKKIQQYVFPVLFSIFYLLTHLWSLTLLPVFADESIYIRWAQLIIDDWKRYAFFPINDGKTPLFIWSLIPFQFLFSDQLFAARMVSVLVGLLQAFITKAILKQLGAREKTQWLGAVLIAALPFFFFAHRVAMMDAMLVLFLSLTVWGVLRLQSLHSKTLFRRGVDLIIPTLFLATAIWTKLPALFIIPALPLLAFANLHTSKKAISIRKNLISIGIVIFGALLLFATLKLVPGFGQLFHRSSDFTYSFSEVLFQQKWKKTLISIPSYFMYFWQYATWPILFLAASGIFLPKSRKNVLIFLGLSLSLAGVFILFGKVVYARYFLPTAFPLVVAACLSAEELFDTYFSKAKQLLRKSITAFAVVFLIGGVLSPCANFFVSSVTSPNTIPFVSSDYEQYLGTWSAGVGIPETVSYIRHQSTNHSIAVATEGRFGTLPDGLLLYFHRQNNANIYIEGTEQYPVKTIPEKFAQRAKHFDQSILVVNSDRMGITLPVEKRIQQICRPNNGTCLQFWDITSLVKSSK